MESSKVEERSATIRMADVVLAVFQMQRRGLGESARCDLTLFAVPDNFVDVVDPCMRFTLALPFDITPAIYIK